MKGVSPAKLSDDNLLESIKQVKEYQERNIERLIE